MSLEDWQNYVLGYSTRGVDEKKSEDIIREWIRTYIKEADFAIGELGNLGSSKIGQEHQGEVQMLLKRWKQIKGLCNKALQAVAC